MDERAERGHVEDPRQEAPEPLVSIITVNYNGEALLGPLLQSLRQQTYPHREVIVVDNGSTDGSLALLDREFPEVRVLRQAHNRGFAGGNNAGIEAARGEWIALANNDTVVEPRWLEALVETARQDPQIAAVASKILFFRPFLPVHLRPEVAVEGGLWCGEEAAFAACDYSKTVFRQGFGGPEEVEGKRVRRFAVDGTVGGEATVYLPVQSREAAARLRLVIGRGASMAGAPPEGAPIPLQVAVGETPVARLMVGEAVGEAIGEAIGKAPTEAVIEVPREVVQNEAFDLINNVGTCLSPAGQAADRGIYEPDRGQYDREEDLEAFCGAAVLFRRSALRAVGAFDEEFFMYYEDTDLSWRLRKAGYRLRYQPASRIRHLHAASSVEWSPMFTYFTARNRVLMIAKNGSPPAFLRAYAHEILLLLRFLWRWVWSRDAHAGAQAILRLRVHRSFLRQIPRAFLKRVGWLASSRS